VVVTRLFIIDLSPQDGEVWVRHHDAVKKGVSFMDFTTAVRTALLERYADFRGRSSRSEYWWFVLFNILVQIFLNLLTSMAAAFAFLSLIVMLGLLVPGIAVGVRRLHDLGKSGWWLLLGFIPIVGAIVLIYWFIQPGEDQPNDWGPNPLGPVNPARTFE